MSQQAHSFIEYMMGDMEINTDVLDSQTQRVWDESSTIDLREAAVADFEVRNLSNMMVATNLTGRLFEWQVKEHFDSNRSGGDLHIGMMRIRFLIDPACK
jgi:hypothetical protein